MNIEVTDNTIVKQIQDDFNKVYPFLWIDFLYHPVTENVQYKPAKIKPETMLNHLGSFKGSKKINIDGNNTVSQLENNFWITLKVITKVLRKSGKVWVGTSYTGNWTLDNQNFEGGQIQLD